MTTSAELTYDDHGAGRPVLLLHGGGGPQTVLPWGRRLSAERGLRVLTPTHPGFAGTPRPASLASIRDLAALYLELVESMDLRDVAVVGSSIGGWIAAEVAALGSPRVSGCVVIDGVGLDVPGRPVADIFSLTPAELAERSWADPATYGLDPGTLAPAELEVLQSNRTALETYAGRAMADPTLRERLGTITVRTLVVWGEADRIVDPGYGRELARAVPGADFRLVGGAGHLPQVERPEVVTPLVGDFIDGGDAPDALRAPASR